MVEALVDVAVHAASGSTCPVGQLRFLRFFY